MDEIDFVILKKLMENSRITYRELAEMLGISVSAVHKRLKNLEEEGSIKAYIARPCIITLNYLAVVIFGTSGEKDLDSVIACCTDGIRTVFYKIEKIED